RIDPVSNRVSRRFPIGALETYDLATGAGYNWICECGNDDDLLRFDPATGKTRRVPLLALPQGWRPGAVGLPRALIGGVDGRPRPLWFNGALTRTLIQWNPDGGGESGPPIGLTGDAIQGTVAKGQIWLAELNVVDRVSTATGRRQTITLPKDMEA